MLVRESNEKLVNGSQPPNYRVEEIECHSRKKKHSLVIINFVKMFTIEQRGYTLKSYSLS